MLQINTITTLSKQDFRKQHPKLIYGRRGEWLAIATPEGEICGLTRKDFPGSESLLSFFKGHALEEAEINFNDTIDVILRGSELQCAVWKALLEIPKGTTVSYEDLAKSVCRPKAVRAVANAVGANPISPLIPCHRVVRKSGALGGYYWGAEVKRELLAAEKV